MAASDLNDTPMGNTSLASSIGAASKTKTAKESKTRELYSSTIGRPPFAYAQIEVVQNHQSQASQGPLDALQVRSYCDAALKQFLGAAGAAMPLDLLKLEGSEFWVRLPREDMGLFAAALAAWSSVSREGTATALRLRASGNWLGSLIGRSQQQALWNGVAT
ncbi:ribonuclease P/MRP protein subunit POP8 [Sporothrix brasiliensis 5110]|uniref:Ribonuclease P/MRP protein subunit POP8 n=1 Tax=Sporothrix brasiliensis 5110 TaxID=1398154 RepID=A0A0C2IP22_9PEZI|nr:ribonuclease P/MRP protein subunit POP8 [Sporothrix brasiliensis 5110]KIH88665.1 ribonuclease P/MRP protein subunit POP8 [Sporothrix brasiliensis 5110]